MNTILIAGAGKSSNHLIHYLLSNASQNKWKIIIADSNERGVNEKINGSPYAKAVVTDITNAAERASLVKQADLVISLMPPDLHVLIAKDCLQHKKNLITSSYISPELMEMDLAAKAAGLMFMCEMGLDPGIDHMTASRLIQGIHRVSGIITGFKSFCGGLIAPESDNNPWHYKFTWNPRNVITAGKGGANYLYHGKQVEVPYEKMFEHAKKVKIAELGQLAYYPNRDSLRYQGVYDLPEVQTFMRATLRHPLFCRAWHAIVILGLTAQGDSFDTAGKTYHSWLLEKSGATDNDLVKHIASRLEVNEDDKIISLLQWLGLFEDKPLKIGINSSADILLDLLQDKWKMEPDDKDMVVMQHEIEYLHKGRKVKVASSMVLKGENREFTAMSKTVGLPIGSLARLFLNKKIQAPKGVVIPNSSAIYRPVLTELAHYGITFDEVIE